MVWSFPKSGRLLTGADGFNRFGRQDCLEGAEAGMSARRSGGEPVGEKTALCSAASAVRDFSPAFRDRLWPSSNRLHLAFSESPAAILRKRFCSAA
jgi:hypothetical protein